MRTGTTSLGTALKTLGFRHTHARRNALLRQVKANKLDQVFAWAEQYDSFEDWPWPLIYEQLDARFPASRFILTVRSDEQAWLRSIVKFSRWVGPTPGREMFFGHAMPTGHEHEYLVRYRAHNQAVREHFRGRPGKLLEISWGAGDEWERLCEFLGTNVPDRPFPVRNTSAAPIRK